MPNYNEKFEKERFRLPSYYFVVAAIFSAVFFFMLLDYFKAYRSEVSILFIPRSEKAIAQASYISENLIRIPKQLSFYEKILADNKEIVDQFAGKSPDERKNLWNSDLSVKREDGSTIFNISVVSKNRDDSLKLARQTVYSLFDTVSRYYDIKTDVDLRIIDGPVASPYAKNLHWVILISIALGLAVSFLLYFIFYVWDRFIKIPKARISPKKEIRLEQELPRQEELFPPIPEKTVTAEKKAVAPSNLPTVEDFYLPYDHEEPFTPEMIEKIKETQPSEAQEPTEEELKERLKQLVREKNEPTEDELKERLNQLLRGEL